MITRQNLLYLSVALLALLPACSSDQAPQGISAGVRPGESLAQSFPGQNILKLRSRIVYERVRSLTDAAGLNPRVATDGAPARFVDVLALDTAGAEIQTAPCATDESGRFELSVPRGVPFRVAVLASTNNSGGRANIEVRDPATAQRFGVTIGDVKTGGPLSFDPRFGTAEIELPAIQATPSSSPPLVTDRPAAAFHILDTCVSVAEEVRKALGIGLPLLTVFWAPDNTVGSFFTESNAPFGPSIFLLGGDPTQDDTDDVDASVIAHEFGHFVSFAALRDSSRGGIHSGGIVLYPSLAFSEGSANALSGMVLNQAAYVDTTAALNNPRFLVVNLENRINSQLGGAVNTLRGIRDEDSVGEVCWDIVDGTDGRVDADGDVAKVDLGGYLKALASLRNQQVYVSLEDLLQALVDTSAIAQATLTTVLSSPENQQISFPPTGTDVFPTRIAVGGLANDTCQTDTTNVGVDVSNRYFQVTLAAPTAVTFRMTLTAAVNGSGANSENIDMFVRTVDNQLARDVNGVVLTPEPGQDGVLVESTGSHTLAPGVYVIEITGRTVDATGNFNNATSGVDVPYRLEVTSP